MTENHIKPVAVIAVGNTLYGDDGFGPRVLEEIKKEPLPERCDTIDASTMGVGLLEYLKGYERVVIIDAAEMGLEPGSVRAFKPDEVRSLEKGAVLSLHSADVLGVIALGKALAEQLADIHIVAVQPERIGLGEGLSDVVEAAVPEAVTQVKRIACGT